MPSKLSCPGCRGGLEAVEVSVAGAGPAAAQRITVGYLCRDCGAHVTRRMDPSAEETIEHIAAIKGNSTPDRPDADSAPARTESDTDRHDAHHMQTAADTLVSLTYMSSATGPFGEEDLRELLAVSRRNNHAQELTGMLLYADGHFIQTLEGPAAAVDAAYERISADHRHRDLIVALRDDIDDRRFADWSMGFDTLAEDEIAGVVGFNDFMFARSVEQQSAHLMGRAGVFHRLFRDRMRPPRARPTSREGR